MSVRLIALIAVLLLPFQTATTPTSTMLLDVDRLVRAAEALTETWPAQPPPPIPEVALVAGHGKAVVPLLMALLSDDPNAERYLKRWKVHQQVALALSRIYSESEHCGRSYCDGDPPERIAHVKDGWLRVIASDKERQALSARELLDRFRAEKMFDQQLQLGQAIAAANDRSVIVDLEPWLTHEDRHVRGNVAFVLGRLGDSRGFDTIVEILADRSPRSAPAGQEFPRGGTWSVQAQIREDRYYAAHLLGDLMDRRGVEILIPLLDDKDVHDIVPWSLSEIGDGRAIEPLIERTKLDDPSARVIAIDALARLDARKALPRLQALLGDSRKASFGPGLTVAEAARRAIAVLSQ